MEGDVKKSKIQYKAGREKRILRKCVLRGGEDVLGDGEELKEAG